MFSCRRWTGTCVQRRPSPGWSYTLRSKLRGMERTSWFHSSHRRHTSRSHRYSWTCRPWITSGCLSPGLVQRWHTDLWPVCCSCWTCVWWTSAHWTTATVSSLLLPSATSPPSMLFIKSQVGSIFLTWLTRYCCLQPDGFNVELYFKATFFSDISFGSSWHLTLI